MLVEHLRCVHDKDSDRAKQKVVQKPHPVPTTDSKANGVDRDRNASASIGKVDESFLDRRRDILRDLCNGLELRLVVQGVPV